MPETVVLLVMKVKTEFNLPGILEFVNASINFLMMIQKSVKNVFIIVMYVTELIEIPVLLAMLIKEGFNLRMLKALVNVMVLVILMTK